MMCRGSGHPPHGGAPLAQCPLAHKRLLQFRGLTWPGTSPSIIISAACSALRRTKHPGFPRDWMGLRVWGRERGQCWPAGPGRGEAPVPMGRHAVKPWTCTPPRGDGRLLMVETSRLLGVSPSCPRASAPANGLSHPPPLFACFLLSESVTPWLWVTEAQPWGRGVQGHERPIPPCPQPHAQVWCQLGLPGQSLCPLVSLKVACSAFPGTLSSASHVTLTGVWGGILSPFSSHVASSAWAPPTGMGWPPGLALCPF